MLSILFLVFHLSLAQAQMPSLVGVVDYVSWGNALNNFDQAEDAKAFREVGYIIFDHFIGRPWGEEAYYHEAEERWQKLRGLVCPGLHEFCGLPPHFQNASDFNSILWGLSRQDVRRELENHYRNAPGGYILDFVDFPGTSKLDMFMSVKEAREEIPSAVFWDMTGKNIVERKKDFTVLYDVETYGSSFSMDQFPTYFGLTDDGQIVINQDKVRDRAALFGRIWKGRLGKIKEAPEHFREATLLNSEEYPLWGFYQKYEARFEPIYQTLLAKVKSLPQDLQKEIMDRFHKERATGDYPEEVFEFVAYEMFQPLIDTQARYFLLAKTQRPGLNLKRQVWESLLALQSQTDPRALLHFASLESFIPTHTILDQYVNPGVAPVFFFEEIKAILGIGEYSGEDIFSRYKYALQMKDLFTKEYLENENPELLAELLDKDTGTIKDVFSMSDQDQRRIFEKYLFQSPQEVRRSGLFRLMASLVCLIKDGDARDLALHIHNIREKEFRP